MPTTPVCERICSVVQDLFQVSRCVDQRNQCRSDDILEKIWKAFLEIISEAARTPEQIGADYIAKYCAEFYLENLGCNLHSHSRISAGSVFISLDHIIPNCARYLPVSRDLLPQLIPILNLLCEEHFLFVTGSDSPESRPSRFYLQVKFLFSWLSVLILTPFPMTEKIVQDLMKMSIKYIQSRQTDSTAPYRMISSLLSRLPDESVRCDFILTELEKLTPENLNSNRLLGPTDTVEILNLCLEERLIVTKPSGLRILGEFDLSI